VQEHTEASSIPHIFENTYIYENINVRIRVQCMHTCMYMYVARCMVHCTWCCEIEFGVRRVSVRRQDSMVLAILLSEAIESESMNYYQYLTDHFIYISGNYGPYVFVGGRR